MLITITEVQPEHRDLFLAWGEANNLGHAMTVKLPITLDLGQRTIRFTRVDWAAGDKGFPDGAQHETLLPLLVDLPEPIMARVGMLHDTIVYPAVMV